MAKLRKSGRTTTAAVLRKRPRPRPSSTVNPRASASRAVPNRFVDPRLNRSHNSVAFIGNAASMFMPGLRVGGAVAGVASRFAASKAAPALTTNVARAAERGIFQQRLGQMGRPPPMSTKPPSLGEIISMNPRLIGASAAEASRVTTQELNRAGLDYPLRGGLFPTARRVRPHTRVRRRKA